MAVYFCDHSKKNALMTFYHKPSRSAEFTRVSAALLIIITFVLSFAFTSSSAAVSAADGQKLFANNCRSCHNTPDKDQDLVGPSLKNEDKKRSEAWLLSWIRNNSALRKSGDKDAVAVWEKYGKNEMPTFLSLSDDDIKSLIAYFNEASNKAPVVVSKGPGGDLGTTGDESADDYTGILWVVVIVLAGISFLIFRINNNLRHYAAEKMGDGVPEERPFRKAIFTKGNIALMLFICVIYSGYWMVNAAQGLGRSRDYQPVQPIKFSHKVHAGQNQINCLYCHAGAEKSKTASIPSVNICMNCHKAVKEGPLTGTAEIAKIYAAYDNNQPIKWVKIHNLPDHVYFNHSQHVKAGQVACQTCHGPVETMDEVKQFASLGMGWCVNCHRNTSVQFEQNKYYEPLYNQLHQQLKDKKIDHVTEGEIGGTECQKCHY